MNRQVKATHLSLLLHALFLWGALQLSQHTQALRPPIALDFSVLAAGGPADSRQPEAAAEIKPPPPPTPPVQKKPVPKPVAKKMPQPQTMPKKSIPSVEEKAPSAETIPVAASTEASTSEDSAASAETTAPAMAQAAGSGQLRGGGSGGLFSVGQLDGPLAVLAKSPPVYPAIAKRRNIEGWIKITFVVDEHGHVGHISVLAAEPEGVFEQSVLQCVGNWRFKPGTVKGMAVRAQVEQTITFKLEG